MGLRRMLLSPPLLLLLAWAPASPGLRCMQCEDSQNCLVKECALGQDLCRTTVLHEWEDDNELELEMRDCAHYEKTNRTMSYRVNSKIISLAEVVCATDVCNRPRPGARGVAFPRGRYLECMSCSSLDQSCERGREQSLQCRYPGEQCVEVVTLRSTERSLKDENYTRGCGSLPGCPGIAGFHGNHTFHFLRCCNSTHCNGGPEQLLEAECGVKMSPWRARPFIALDEPVRTQELATHHLQMQAHGACGLTPLSSTQCNNHWIRGLALSFVPWTETKFTPYRPAQDTQASSAQMRSWNSRIYDTKLSGPEDFKDPSVRFASRQNGVMPHTCLVTLFEFQNHIKSTSLGEECFRDPQHKCSPENFTLQASVLHPTALQLPQNLDPGQALKKQTKKPGQWWCTREAESGHLSEFEASLIYRVGQPGQHRETLFQQQQQ